MRLALHLTQEQTAAPSSKSKGIAFREGHSGEDDSVVDELQRRVNVLDQKNIELSIRVEDLLSENTNLKIQVSDLQEDKALKTKQISDLQEHFNLLTSSYFDLKKKLEEELGDKFKTSADESRINLHIQAHPIVTSAQTSHVVDRFEDEPTQAPSVVALKRAKLDKSTDTGKYLLKRILDQTAFTDQPTITFTYIGENHFKDIYGDRSRIISWGFHDTLNMWIMKRKSGNTELCKDAHDFNS